GLAGRAVRPRQRGQSHRHWRGRLRHARPSRELPRLGRRSGQHALGRVLRGVAPLRSRQSQPDTARRRGRDRDREGQRVQQEPPPGRAGRPRLTNSPAVQPVFAPGSRLPKPSETSLRLACVRAATGAGLPCHLPRGRDNQVRNSRCRLLWLPALLVSFSLVAAACGGHDEEETSTPSATAGTGTADQTASVSGEVNISGSSTVEPISIRVAELFEDVAPDVSVNVDGPGTGDGFKLFCAGDTDISDASRQIKPAEKEDCFANGITDIVELKVAVDGIAVMTNASNDAVECLTFEQLFDLIGPDGEGTSTWAEASAGLPDAPLDLFGPGEESGTFDSFIEIVLEDLAGEAGVDATTRTDYSPSGDDNVIIQGIQSSDTSLGWVGFAFAINASGVKLLEIDGGDGCVAPTGDTIASNEYPVSRDLWIYVNADAAAANPALVAYVDFYVSDALSQAVGEVGYVPLAGAAHAETAERWHSRSLIS
ncbi:MAG: phosphate ABC transporter substrate-binding protein PstS family protein, partial [Acidimicrobiaceae bacterium]|nr:phosphate ABC transporter substrate-binding protein PstS family protein [Acidimicrobiaceae bacterium]